MIAGEFCGLLPRPCVDAQTGKAPAALNRRKVRLRVNIWAPRSGGHARAHPFPALILRVIKRFTSGRMGALPKPLRSDGESAAGQTGGGEAVRAAGYRDDGRASRQRRESVFGMSLRSSEIPFQRDFRRSSWRHDHGPGAAGRSAARPGAGGGRESRHREAAIAGVNRAGFIEELLEAEVLNRYNDCESKSVNIGPSRPQFSSPWPDLEHQWSFGGGERIAPETFTSTYAQPCPRRTASSTFLLES